MATIPTTTRTPARPAMDEWGMYDPQQAGLAALFARLDARSKAQQVDDLKTPIAPAQPYRPTLRDAI